MATYVVSAENTQGKIQNGDAPIITILTHGENEKDSIFTQEGCNSNSLFEQLCANGKTERYRLQCNFITDSALLFKLSPPQKVGEAYLTENITTLELDITKHSVILFKSFLDTGIYTSLDTSYEEFKIAVNALLEKYCETRGYYPKINLVGSSSGGLINMKYAMEYPQRVDTMLSIGAPYNGSILAPYTSLRNYFGLNYISEQLRTKSTKMGNNELALEIPETLQTLKNQWNSLEQKPKTYAISMGMNSSYVVPMICDIVDKRKPLFKDYIKDQINKGKNDLPNLIVSNIEMIDTYEINGIKDDFPSDENATLKLFLQKLSQNFKDVNDNGAYLMSSQSGEGYEGITPINMMYTEADFNALRTESPNIITPYNSALKTQKVISAVTSRIRLGVFEYSDVYSVYRTESEVHITGVKKREITSLLVPETIAGLPVTEISPYAFYDFPAVKHIQIEANVRYIAPENFALCPNLESVSLAGSQNYETENGVLYDKGKTATALSRGEKGNSVHRAVYGEEHIGVRVRKCGQANKRERSRRTFYVGIDP